MNEWLEIPENIDEMRKLLVDLAKQNRKLESKNTQLEIQINQYQEQIALLLHKRFGANSEKYSAEQSDLFNEAETYAEELARADDAASEQDNTQQDDNQTEVIAYTRQKNTAGRKPLPEHLPRVEVVHALPEAQRVCPEGHPLKEIGADSSEQLDIIPAKIQVIVNKRIKYACPCCQGHIKLAPLPAQPIPKSNASPGLLAYVATSKFLDALPLYRQSKQFERIGVEIPRSTLAFWMIRSGELVQPLFNLMQDQLNLYPILQMDETRVQVLKEADKSPSSQSYVWARRSLAPDKPVVLFNYAASRGQSVADHLLQSYTGVLQTDGYAGYSGLCVKRGLQHVGCWAHVRRKFDEALKAQGNKGKAGKASKALLIIQKLYRVETLIKGLSPTEKQRIRQQQSAPILNELKDWMDKSLTQVTPSSLTGKALRYMVNQWSTLIVYCDNGSIEIDNNGVERAIRPFVIGRRNWLFSDTVKGAKASANLYSLIETAKLNGLEPYRYLRHILTALPKANSLEEIDALLPWAVDKETINEGWAIV
jgi:transposase